MEILYYNNHSVTSDYSDYDSFSSSEQNNKNGKIDKNDKNSKNGKNGKNNKNDKINNKTEILESMSDCVKRLTAISTGMTTEIGTQKE